MESSRTIAKEISQLIPRLLGGLRAGFVAGGQVTTSQMVALLRIYEKKSIRIGHLSKQMRVSAPAITGVIDRLQRDGYLRRVHDEEDRRAINVELTDKGARLARQILSDINNRWYAILVKLKQEERQDYLRILKRIVSIVS